MTSTHSEDGKYAFGAGKYAPELWEVRIGAWEVRIWIHNPGLRHVCGEVVVNVVGGGDIDKLNIVNGH